MDWSLRDWNGKHMFIPSLLVVSFFATAQNDTTANFTATPPTIVALPIEDPPPALALYRTALLPFDLEHIVASRDCPW